MRGRLLKLLTLPLVLAMVAVYLWVHRESFSDIHLDRPWMLLVVVVGVVMNLLAASAMNRFMARELGAPLSHLESLALAAIASVANAILPARSGAGIRGAYLKKVHGLSLAAFASSLFGFQVLTTASAAGIAGLALAWLSAVGPPGIGPVAVAVLACLVASVVALTLPPVGTGKTRLRRKLSEFMQGWHSIKGKPATLLLLTVLATGQVVASLIVLWGSMAALGSDLSALAIIVTGSLGVIATLFSITPGSLGIYEAVVGLAGSVLGGDSIRLVSAALLQRLSAIVTAALLAGTTWRFLKTGSTTSAASADE